jgi:hypothetical protein
VHTIFAQVRFALPDDLPCPVDVGQPPIFIPTDGLRLLEARMEELGLRQPAGLPQSSSSGLAQLTSNGFSPPAGQTRSFFARLPFAASAYDLRPTHRTASGASDRPD